MSANPPQTKEYYVKVAKTEKRYHALKFHISDNVEFKASAKPEMTREPTQYYQRIDTESQPKFGAGSEFGKEGREIARRKKFGWSTKGTTIDDLPWLLSMKGEDGKEKQYRGKKSVSDNSCYYIFVHNTDGGFDAYPLEDWYSFVAHRTYKTLNIDEAEEEFSKRHTILNKYTIMANKRKTEAQTEGDDGEETKKGKGKAKRPHGFALTEMDYWSEGGEGADDDDEEEGEREGSEGSEGKKKKKAAPKKNNNGDDDENIGKVSEESDDGDREGEELDYSTSESESEEELETTKGEEKYKEIGIDEEVAIKAFEEEEDEENELTEEGKEYNKLIHEHAKEEIKDIDELSKDSAKKSSADDFNESDFSDSSSFDEIDNEPIIPTKVLGSKKKAKDTSSTSSGATSAASKSETTSAKRKAADDLGGKSTKKQATTSESSESKPTTSAKTEASGSKAEASSSNKFEDEVRYYLRKPMTTKEIIQKLKKKSSLPNDKLQENISQVLNKLNQAKQLKIEDINGVKYISLLKP